MKPGPIEATAQARSVSTSRKTTRTNGRLPLRYEVLKEIKP